MIENYSLLEYFENKISKNSTNFNTVVKKIDNFLYENSKKNSVSCELLLEIIELGDYLIKSYTQPFLKGNSYLAEMYFLYKDVRNIKSVPINAIVNTIKPNEKREIDLFLNKMSKYKKAIMFFSYEDIQKGINIFNSDGTTNKEAIAYFVLLLRTNSLFFATIENKLQNIAFGLYFEKNHWIPIPKDALRESFSGFVKNENYSFCELKR